MAQSQQGHINSDVKSMSDLFEETGKDWNWGNKN